MSQARRTANSTASVSAGQGAVHWTGGRPLFMYSLRHPLLRLRSPLAVSLQDDGFQTIAVSYDLDVFGYGETEGEALDDLRHVVGNLYFTLKENAGQLAPLPQRVWEYLSDVIEEVRAA